LYYVLSEALKRRIIQELREFWSQDPKYKDTLQIQGKFSFEERPQQAIVMKNVSATPFRLSADNFQGIVESYCHLYRAFGKPGLSIEWIREDGRQIQKAGGEFPSPPGIYYIEVRREPYEYQGVIRDYLVFYVDPLYASINERPVQVSPTQFDVVQGSFHPGSLAVWEMPGNLPLYEDYNWKADPTTGRIELARPLPSGTYLSVDYYYAGESRGPFPVPENGADNKAIPGVVLVFGRKASDGDVMAVQVTPRREGNTREYGGRFEMSVDLDLMARDVHAQGEITDRTLMYLQAQLRDRLSFEGIEIDQVTGGGEAEEQYDETGDDYYYTSSISLTLFTDWAIYVPFGPYISRVTQGTLQKDKAQAAMDDEQLLQSGIPAGILATDQLGLQAIEDPWFKDRSRNFETLR
jgi:hypothetical protein